MSSRKTIFESSISDDVIVFKSICMDLFYAQIDNKPYDEIVNMVLRTEYGNIARSDTITLNEIAYIFDITRERVRQIELASKKRIEKSKATFALRRYLALSGEYRSLFRSRAVRTAASKKPASGLNLKKQ